jgi:hypothetical protein
MKISDLGGTYSDYSDCISKGHGIIRQLSPTRFDFKMTVSSRLMLELLSERNLAAEASVFDDLPSFRGGLRERGEEK